MAMAPQSCRLCGKAAVLQESHIVPAFVFRWMKETSATGFLRFGQQPDRRVQDGAKQYWLCTDCEQLFSAWETRFASQVFHPLMEDGGKRIRYEDWMLKFCVSLSWRVLLLFTEESELHNLSEPQGSAARHALSTWSDFMQGKGLHPGVHEQHFLPLDTVESFGGGHMPANINRYLLRAVDLDIAAGESGAFVYCKFAKFILVGFIHMSYPKQWIGTKVHVREGHVGRAEFTLPRPFGDFIFAKSKRYAELNESISEKQQEKIAATMRGDLVRTAGSGSLAALDADVRLFGQDAFKKLSSEDER